MVELRRVGRVFEARCMVVSMGMTVIVIVGMPVVVGMRVFMRRMIVIVTVFLAMLVVMMVVPVRMIARMLVLMFFCHE